MNKYADYWFISSSNNLDKFSKLYDKIKDYHLRIYSKNIEN